MLKRIASNAAANIVNGMTIAGFQLGMTAIIARGGNIRDLPIWSLAMSIAGFAPLFGCNISSAVTRRLAIFGKAVPDTEIHNSTIMRAARSVAKWLSLLGLVIAVILALTIPFLYARVVAPLYWQAGVVVGAIFAGMCWMAFIQPEQGWLMTAHRNWPIAQSGMIVRGLALLVAAAALFVLKFPVWLAVLASSASLWGGVWYLRREVPRFAPVSADALRPETRHIFAIARSFAVWNITSAAVQISTVPIIGLIDSPALTSVFLSYTLISIILGVATAASSALVAPLAHLLGDGNLVAVERVAVRVTILLWGGLLTTFAVVYFALPIIVPIWIGSHHHTVVLPVLQRAFLLVGLQQGLRSTNMVTSIVFSMGARPDAMLYSPLTEAAGFVLIAVPLAIAYGSTPYLLGLAAAASAGGLAVLILTKKEVLSSSGHLGIGWNLIATVVALQIMTVATFGIPLLIGGRG